MAVTSTPQLSAKTAIIAMRLKMMIVYDLVLILWPSLGILLCWFKARA